MSAISKSSDGLLIFDKRLEIDYSLPKWKGSVKLNGDSRLESLIKGSEGTLSNPSFYKDLLKDNLTIPFDRRLSEGFFEPTWSNDVNSILPDNLPEFKGSVDKVDCSNSGKIIISEPEMESREKEICNISSEISELLNHKPFFWTRSKYKKALDTLMERENSLVEDKKRFVVRGSTSEKIYGLDILKFFESVRLDTVKKSATYYNRVEHFIKQLQDASIMGQSELCEELLANININKLESVLVSHGYNIGISESKMIELINRSGQDLDICYISSFLKPQSEYIVKKKAWIDKLGVFDNYCVLYSNDPFDDSFIIFGMIRRSRKFYFIVDSEINLILKTLVEYCGCSVSDFAIDKNIGV